MCESVSESGGQRATEGDSKCDSEVSGSGEFSPIYLRERENTQ